MRRRFAVWAAERFPLELVVLLLPMSLAALLIGRAGAGAPGEVGSDPVNSVPVLPGAVAALAAAWACFFVIRVCDEHKDYTVDCRNHPQRALQRGLITLGDLRHVAAAAVGLQLLVTVGFALWWQTVVPLVAWLVASLWLGLMTKEFFVRDFLVPRLPLYAASHMVVAPLIIYWIMSLGAAASGNWPQGAAVWSLCVMAYAAGAALETGRKLHSPVDERAGVDSYSKQWGVAGASLVVGGAVIVADLALLGVLHALIGDAWPWWSAAAVAPAVAVLLVLADFTRRAESGKGKQVEASVNLLAVVLYGMALVAALVTEGGQWI